MKLIISITLFITLLSCVNYAEENSSTIINLEGFNIQDTTKIKKSKSEWRRILTDEAYRILIEKGTERAFTGEYWDNNEKGVYYCNGCKIPLFNSDTKFKSGTGWPSFYDKIGIHVKTVDDISFGMIRSEVICNSCNGHLGHVFGDGPEPTGLRYCINSAALEFKIE